MSEPDSQSEDQPARPLQPLERDPAAETRAASAAGSPPPPPPAASAAGSPPPVTPAAGSPPPPPAKQRFPVAVKAAIAAALILASGSVWLAVSSRSDAQKWEDQVASLQASVERADSRADDLIRELNEKTHLVNVSAAKLSRSQASLKSSESDVKSLAARQRELADEKAQLEDQRVALASLANALDAALKSGQKCQSELYGLITALAKENYTYLQLHTDSAFAVCDSADTQFQSAQGLMP